ncbi:Bulb-type lectin domain - like 4 [Theobroma cacao]|nr:Bulb-type lectin domain - like 4 [Theobroma cacao]
MALALLRLFSFLVLLPILAAAQTVGNVTVGASLSAVENSSWISPSGDFAFGFNQLNNKDLFLLAIWYNKIPEKTIVWYANGDRPAPRGSRLLLTADRGFVLTSPQGEQLWNTETINGVVRSGVLDDTGNLMLRGSNSILWESFKNPADTMLPSQKLDKGVALSSRQSDSNFTEGRFRMVLQSDGNLVLTTINLPSDHFNEPYYKSDTAGDFNSSSPGFQVVFNESGYLFVLRENEERFLLTTTITDSAKDFYCRATLSFDGIFSLYSHPKASTGNSRWTTVWSNPDNICTASLVTASSGVCGFNSICSLNAERRPNCGCPRGYTLVYPNDQYGSCKPNFTQSCEEEPAPVEDLYDFEVLTNVDWPLADYALLEPFTEEKCRESCLHDCMCAVAIFRLGDRCWKKKLPLSNGRVDPSLDGAKALLKVRKGDPPPLGPYFPNQEMKKKNQESLILALTVILGVVGTNLRSFTYKELVYATNEFKEELGRGAFGIVYKGALDMNRNCDLEERAILTDWAYDCYREGILDALVENDTDALNDRGKVERFVQVAIWCIQEDPSLRPTMRKATQMLEGVVEVPIPPCPYTTTA